MKYSEEGREVMSNFLKKEFLLCLEMYRAFNDNLIIHGVQQGKNGKDAFQALNKAHTDNIHEKITNLGKGEVYTYPTGYPSHEVEHRLLWFLPLYAREQVMGHSMYASFSKVQNDVIQIRIDNLGPGSEKHLDANGKRNVKDREKECAISPCLMLVNEREKRLEEYLSDITKARFDQDFDKSSERTYPLEKIYLSYCERDKNWPLQRSQSIDNCVIANYLIGLYIRLYELSHQLGESKNIAGKLLNWMEGHLYSRASDYEIKATRTEFSLDREAPSVSGLGTVEDQSARNTRSSEFQR